MHPELAPETEDLNILGIRDIDLQYRRDAHLGLYTHPHFHNGTYWPEYIGTEDAPVPEYVGLGKRDTLNREQRLVYDTVIGHSQQDQADQLLLQIDGGGGTGKSYRINILAAYLRQASSIEDPVDIRARPLVLLAAIFEERRFIHCFAYLLIRSSNRLLPLSCRSTKAPKVLEVSHHR